MAGSYLNVPLTGGAGTGALATVTVSTGGVVTGAPLTNRGYGYAAGDTLSASSANLGGSGSGFTLTVNSIYGPDTIDGVTLAGVPLSAGLRALFEVTTFNQTSNVGAWTSAQLGVKSA